MSDERKNKGQIALGWWKTNIGARESSSARALASRLRRAGLVRALSEGAVQDLGHSLGAGAGDAKKLVRLACLLAEVREHDGSQLARRLGGSEKKLSELRFQRLMRAEGEGLEALMRRAIVIAERRCNVAALADDLWYWSDAARTRWCFHYFGADAPSDKLKEKSE